MGLHIDNLIWYLECHALNLSVKKLLISSRMYHFSSELEFSIIKKLGIWSVYDVSYISFSYFLENKTFFLKPMAEISLLGNTMVIWQQYRISNSRCLHGHHSLIQWIWVKMLLHMSQINKNCCPQKTFATRDAQGIKLCGIKGAPTLKI